MNEESWNAGISEYWVDKSSELMQEPHLGFGFQPTIPSLQYSIIPG